jgi:hypothetical protein
VVSVVGCCQMNHPEYSGWNHDSHLVIYDSAAWIGLGRAGEAHLCSR